MSRRGRILRRLLIAIIAIAAAWFAPQFGVAWYHQRQAERLLAYVQTLHAGVTSERDFRAALEPMERRLAYHEIDRENPSKTVYYYQFYNGAEGLNRVYSVLGRFRPVGHYLMVDWAMFQVSATFQSGILNQIHLYEFDLPADEAGHPFASIVTMYAKQASDKETFAGYDVPAFSGYRVLDRMIDDDMGRALPKPVLFQQRVQLDDRATPEEQRRALQFNLGCFTAVFGCRDASRMLHPVPEPKP